MNDIRICDLRDGMEFTCKILGRDVRRGVVAIEDDKVYLCQDDIIGDSPRDKRGFECGWEVGNTGTTGSVNGQQDVTDFRLLDVSELPICTGNVLADGGGLYSLVLFANEYMVIRSYAAATPDVDMLKKEDSAYPCSLSELKRGGWKRYIPGTVSDEDVEKAIKTLETAGRIVDGKVVTDA